MQLAMVAAGFTPRRGRPAAPGDGDLRRNGHHRQFRDKLIDGMVEQGYPQEFAERCFSRSRASASTASPRATPPLRAAGLRLGLAQVPPPGGVRRGAAQQPADGLLRAGAARPRAREHGVRCGRSTSIAATGTARWKRPPAALRCASGFRQVKGFAEADAERLVLARGNGYADPLSLWRRSGLGGARWKPWPMPMRSAPWGWTAGRSSGS